MYYICEFITLFIGQHLHLFSVLFTSSEKLVGHSKAPVLRPVTSLCFILGDMATKFKPVDRQLADWIDAPVSWFETLEWPVIIHELLASKQHSWSRGLCMKIVRSFICHNRWQNLGESKTERTRAVTFDCKHLKAKFIIWKPNFGRHFVVRTSSRRFA